MLLGHIGWGPETAQLIVNPGMFATLDAGLSPLQVLLNCFARSWQSLSVLFAPAQACAHSRAQTRTNSKRFIIRLRVCCLLNAMHLSLLERFICKSANLQPETVFQVLYNLKVAFGLEPRDMVK